MKGLSTDAGTSWLGFLMLVYGGISQMPEGNLKGYLHLAILIAGAVISFAIKGSGIDPVKGQEMMNAHDMVEDVLKRGRQ